MTPLCPSSWVENSDAGSVCEVDCTSTDPASDVAVQISANAPHANWFTARVGQTRPLQVGPVYFSSVTASWSGHFFNFEDSSSRLPLEMHLLTRGYQGPDLDNLEVYYGDNTYGGPIDSDSVTCAIRGY